MTTQGSGASAGHGDGFHNEDAYLAEDGLGLYVVCDAACGRPAGEIAANTAVEALEEFVARSEEISAAGLLKLFSSRLVAKQAVRHAMAAVLELAESHSELSGQPASVSMLLAQGNEAAISHTGDSRVYLIRRAGDQELIHQLTSDHHLTDSQPEEPPDSAEEAQIDPASIKIDTFLLTLQPGDTYVLCTDGAEEVVEDPHVLGPVSETSPRMLAYRIVTAAHKHNPDVDATVVVVRVRDDKEPAKLWLSKVPKKFKLGHALAWT